MPWSFTTRVSATCHSSRTHEPAASCSSDPQLDCSPQCHGSQRATKISDYERHTNITFPLTVRSPAILWRTALHLTVRQATEAVGGWQSKKRYSCVHFLRFQLFSLSSSHNPYPRSADQRVPDRLPLSVSAPTVASSIYTSATCHRRPSGFIRVVKNGLELVGQRKPPMIRQAHDLWPTGSSMLFHSACATENAGNPL